MEIKNSQGQIIFQCDGDIRKANLDDIDLSGAMLENANLEGVVWCGTNLSRANLKAADFYWAILFTSNLSYADLQEAQFRGADLKEVNFQGANLMNTNFGRDNLGGSTQLQGANLSQAQTRGAIFDGAEYDTRTVFPELFDPKKEGMCLCPWLPNNKSPRARVFVANFRKIGQTGNRAEFHYTTIPINYGIIHSDSLPHNRRQT